MIHSFSLYPLVIFSLDCVSCFFAFVQYNHLYLLCYQNTCACAPNTFYVSAHQKILG